MNFARWWLLRKKRRQLALNLARYRAIAAIPGDTSVFLAERMWRVVSRIARLTAEIKELEQ